MAGGVTYAKAEEDLAAMYRDFFFAALRRRSSRSLLITGLGCAGLALIGRWIDGSVDGDGKSFYVAAIGVLCFFPICWAISYTMLPHRARTMFRQQRTNDPVWTWCWSNEGLQSHSGTGEQHYRWEELHRWWIGGKTMMLFVNDNHILYIPRRVLSDEQVEDFRTTISQSGLSRY